MNTQNQKQQEQKKSSFEEGLMDNSHNQSGTPKMTDKPEGKKSGHKTDPEIEMPFNSPEKTEKKIPDMQGDKE